MGIGELAMKNVTAFGSEIDFLEGYIFHDAIFLDGSDVYCNEECARKFNLSAKDYACGIVSHVTMNFKSITA